MIDVYMCVFLQSSQTIEEKIETAAELLTSSSLLNTQYDVSLTADIVFQVLFAQVSFSDPKKVSKTFVHLF